MKTNGRTDFDVFDDIDDFGLVVDLIPNTPIANADTPNVPFDFYFEATLRSGIIGKIVNRYDDSVLH